MQLWYNLPLSSFPISLIFLHSCFLHVCASLSHYSISWRCCVWCVWWSSCSLPLRPINRSLSRVAVVFCIWIARRALWWLLGRLLCLSIQNWWDSLISLCQTDFLSDRLSPFAIYIPLNPLPSHSHFTKLWSLNSESIKYKAAYIFPQSGSHSFQGLLFVKETSWCNDAWVLCCSPRLAVS